MRLDAAGARLGEYTCAAEGVLDGLPPRDRDSEDHFVPFFGFGIRTEDTETGPNGLIVHAERIGRVSTAYFRALLAREIERQRNLTPSSRIKGILVT